MGGFVGKGDRQNLVGTRAMSDKICNTVGQDFGLAGTSASQNQDGASQSLDRLTLGWIQTS